MKINWKVRFKSKVFVSSLIALLLLLANQIAGAYGVDITVISNEITTISETILTILVFIGLLNDPSTENGPLGLNDSEMAMRYKTPRKDS